MALPCATLEARRCSATPRHVTPLAPPASGESLPQDNIDPWMDGSTVHGRSSQNHVHICRLSTALAAELQMFLFSSCWYAVTTGQGGHGYCRPCVVSTLSPHLSLTMFSTNSLQILYFAVIRQSHPSLSRYLLTQSSHRILGLRRLLFPPVS